MRGFRDVNTGGPSFETWSMVRWIYEMNFRSLLTRFLSSDGGAIANITNSVDDYEYGTFYINKLTGKILFRGRGLIGSEVPSGITRANTFDKADLHVGYHRKNMGILRDNEENILQGDFDMNLKSMLGLREPTLGQDGATRAYINNASAAAGGKLVSEIGSYTGDDGAERVISLTNSDLLIEFVWVSSGSIFAAAPVFKSRLNFTANESRSTGGSFLTDDRLEEIDTRGQFTVGANNATNNLNDEYSYYVLGFET